MQDFGIIDLHKEANLRRKNSFLEKILGWVLCTLSQFTLRIQNSKISEKHEGRCLREDSNGFQSTQNYFTVSSTFC